MQQLENPVKKQMSTIRVSEKMKSRLAKIGARLTLKDGQTRSMEDLLELLADAYEREENSKK